MEPNIQISWKRRALLLNRIQVLRIFLMKMYCFPSQMNIYTQHPVSLLLEIEEETNLLHGY